MTGRARNREPSSGPPRLVDRKPLAALNRMGTYVWAAAAALLASTVLSIRWWHPYCDAQADGPGYYARGFPLPYAAPTGVSSLELTYMPHVLALDLAAVGCAAFALLWLFWRRRPAGTGTLARLGSIAGLVLFLLLAALQGMWLRAAGIPQWSSTWSADSYWSYRPAALAVGARHRACDS
jgi:hypothetical protein